MRAHPEDAYVCATHSPVFINAADPEACWLVIRDDQGTAMRSVFADGYSRRHIFAELGIDPGDVALSEHVLFVEGPSDLAVYPMLLARLGFNTVQRNCLVISLAGADLTRPLSAVFTELSGQLNLPFSVLLDGDKRGQYSHNPNVCFPPVNDLEELFRQDRAAVREGFLTALAQEDSDRAKEVEAQWSAADVAAYFVEHRHAETKAASLLTGLARGLSVAYRKPVRASMIAAHLEDRVVEQLRPILMPRLQPERTGAEEATG